jgi:hypothetical protein
MADTARALAVVKRVVEMCDFIGNPNIQENSTDEDGASLNAARH